MPNIRLRHRTTKAERKQARRNVHLNRLPANTVRRYDVALRLFFVWFTEVSMLINNVFELDDAVGRYIVNLWQEGDTIGLAGDTLSGLQYRLKFLKKCLSGSWSLIGKWRAKELPNRAPPLPLSVVLALAGGFLQIGEVGMAAGVLLSFHCFLRAMETFTLQNCDIQLAKGRGIVNLRSTKKGCRDIATIDDSLVVAVLLLTKRRLKRNDLLIPHSPQRCRVLFYEMLTLLGVIDLGFKWHSFRRGGATNHFQSYGRMDLTLHRGRWEHSRTAKIYIADGLLASEEMSFTKEQLKSLSTAASYLSVFD